MGNSNVANNNSENLLDNNINNGVDGQVHLYVEQTRLKKTVYIKNPVNIKRDKVKLERDAINRNIHYLEVEYDAMTNFQLRIFLNAKPNIENISGFHKYCPSENFINDLIKTECDKGFNVILRDRNLAIDLDEYFRKKTEHQGGYDIVLEIIPFIDGRLEENIIFYTLCSFQEKNTNGRGINYSAKVEMQKLKVFEKYLDIFEVYNSSTTTYLKFFKFEKI